MAMFEMIPGSHKGQFLDLQFWMCSDPMALYFLLLKALETVLESEEGE